jgi:hypothetical protein
VVEVGALAVLAGVRRGAVATGRAPAAARGERGAGISLLLGAVSLPMRDRLARAGQGRGDW